MALDFSSLPDQPKQKGSSFLNFDLLPDKKKEESIIPADRIPKTESGGLNLDLLPDKPQKGFGQRVQELAQTAGTGISKITKRFNSGGSAPVPPMTPEEQMQTAALGTRDLAQPLKPEPTIGPLRSGETLTPPVPGEEEQAELQRNIKLIRQYPYNYETGVSMPFESLMRGVLPLRQKELLPPDLETAYPWQNLAGQITGLLPAGAATKGVGLSFAGLKALDKVKLLNTTARFMGARAAQTGAAMGLKETSDQIAKAISGEKLSAGEAAGEIGKATAFGAGLGALGGIPKALVRIPSEMAYGYGTATMQGADTFHAGLNSLLFGAFGLFNRANLTNKQMMEYMTGFRRAVVDQADALGYDKEKAAEFSEKAIQHIYVKATEKGVTPTIGDFQKIAKGIEKGAKVEFPEAPGVLPGKTAPTPAPAGVLEAPRGPLPTGQPVSPVVPQKPIVAQLESQKSPIPGEVKAPVPAPAPVEKPRSLIDDIRGMEAYQRKGVEGITGEKETIVTGYVPPCQRDIGWMDNQEKQYAELERSHTSEIPESETVSPGAPSGATAASKGPYPEVITVREGTAELPFKFGGLEKVKAMEMPEIVKLAKHISQKVPTLKKFPSSYGMFYSNLGNIKLHPVIFKDPTVSARVLAHEIGHLTDWIPDKTLKRGNLIGRVTSSVTQFLAHTFKEDEKLDRKGLRNAAFKKFLLDNKLTMGDWITKKEVRAKHKGELAKATKEAIDDAIKTGGFLVDKELRDELEALTQYWKPFDEEQNPGYTAYRLSGEELYADFVSVILNAPLEAKTRAPKFYQAFFEHLSKKPSVANAFMDLQDLIQGADEDLLKVRKNDSTKMWADAETVLKAKMQERELAKKSMFDRIKQVALEKNTALLKGTEAAKKAGVVIAPADDPSRLIETYFRSADVARGEMRDFDQKVYEPLLKDGFSWADDFATYLYFDRIVGLTEEEAKAEYQSLVDAFGADHADKFERWVKDRKELANPLGHNPKTAEKQIEFMKKEMGDEIFKKLEVHAQAFRDWYKTIVKIYMSNIFTPEQFALATSDVKYAPFRATSYLKEYVSAGMMGQVGTLGDVANPATAMVMKAISMISSGRKNDIRMKIGNTISGNAQFFGKVQPAKITSYPGVFHVAPAPEPFLKPVIWRQNGKWRGLYLDEWIADSFENDDQATLRMIGETIDWILLNKLWRPIYTTFNLTWSLFTNPIRDFLSYVRYAPKGYKNTIPQALKAYWKAKGPVFRALKGEHDPLIAEMEKNAALSISFDYLLNEGRGKEDTEIERVYSKYLGAGEKSKGFWIKRQMVGMLNGIARIGSFFDALPKVAGWQKFENLPPAERTHVINNYIATPNRYRRGGAYFLYNSVWIFSNMNIQGLRRSLEIARDPKTRAGFWWRTIQLGVLPKILMWLAGLGAFGAAVKQNMDSATDYDKTNWNVIPIGWMDSQGNFYGITDPDRPFNSEAMYLRFPQEESMRMIGGLFYRMLQLDKDTSSYFQSLFQFTGGQLPGLSTGITTPYNWALFAQGQIPKDGFRGWDILTEDEMKAGGWDALEPMVRWTINQSGLVRLDIMDRAKESPIQKTTLSVLPVLQSMVRITNYGQVEKGMELVKGKQAEEARARLERKDQIKEAVRSGKSKEEFRYEFPAKERSTVEKAFEKLAIRKEKDPVKTALSRMTSNKQKIVFLRTPFVKNRFENDDKYYEYLYQLKQDGLISDEIISGAAGGAD